MPQFFNAGQENVLNIENGNDLVTITYVDRGCFSMVNYGPGDIYFSLIGNVPALGGPSCMLLEPGYTYSLNNTPVGKLQTWLMIASQAGTRVSFSLGALC